MDNSSTTASTEAEAAAVTEARYDPEKPHTIGAEIAELGKAFPLLAAQLTKYFG
jgi:hypothetical protein